MIQKLYELIDNTLDETNDVEIYKKATKLEDYLFFNYELIAKQDKKIAYEADQILPDIIEPLEIGTIPDDFKEKLALAKRELINMDADKAH